MRVSVFTLAMLLPVAAMAQQAPVSQSSLPTLQQVLDQKSAAVADFIAQLRGQITQDQSTIAAMSQQSNDLSTKVQTLEKQVKNLQDQLDAATKAK